MYSGTTRSLRAATAFFVFISSLFSVLSGHAQVVISEVMYHPAPASPEQTWREWLELYNPGPSAVDLANWRIANAVSFTFPNVTLQPGSYLVVAANHAAFMTNYPGVTNVVGDWTGKLRNSRDHIELLDSTGQKVDNVAYTSEGDWALRREGEPYPGWSTWWRGWQWTTPADGAGKSLELINAQRSNALGQNWAASTTEGGTPGRANSVAAPHSAPFILNVQHRPIIPHSTNTVTVSAKVEPEPGVVPTVTAWFRIDGAPSFSSVPMLDDGQHGDGIAGDSVYGARLPAQANKTVVEFYVQATDSQGLSRTWPGPTDTSGTQGANALYQVDDFTYAGSQPLYRFIIKASEWDIWNSTMSNGQGGQFDNAEMNASVVRVDSTGTANRYLASIRNRGAGTRVAHPHNLHLSIPLDNPLDGVVSLDFNTRTVQSQVAGNAVLSAAGLLNAYGAPVQVRVNGDNLAHAAPDGSTDSYQFGSYYCFQPYDSEWAADNIPSDPNGNLYKGFWFFDTVQLSRGATLDYFGTDVMSYKAFYSPDGPTSASGPYSKDSNTAEDDWSDLINLTRTLSPETPDSNYLQAVEQVVNIDQWLRYFAVNSLLLNMETTLSTGTGDDYSMYRGIVDPRFQLISHDLDTVLGAGDASPDYPRSIFRATRLPALARFLQHPKIAPRYFAILKDLADTTFSPEQIGPILDQSLKGWVPDLYIDAMKTAAEIRRTNVLAQIPLTLTAQSQLPFQNGYLRSTTASTSLSGTADAIHTRSILVNGIAADYTAWQGAWTATNIGLQPGINRVLVQAMDSSGTELSRQVLSIWYDTGTTTSASGTIAANTTWKSASGPYRITSNLTVPSGVTLTIEPGTTVYLNSGVNVTVANGGRILAEGSSNAPIVFATAPGETASWGGITINGIGASPESRFLHAFFQGNSTTCIEVAGGTIYMEACTFGTTSHQYLALDGSSFHLKDCVFPSSSSGFELVHGTQGIKAGGRGIIQRCFFGTTSGYNDIIDFTGGNRDLGQPILQCYDNVFVGASDDILDLDGTDAWLEGNIFLHVHKNGAPDSSSAISGGQSGGNKSEITIIRNLFFDCDQAVTAKEGNFFTLLNNTIVKMTNHGGVDTDYAALNTQDKDPGPPTTYGAGFYLEGNIITDTDKLVRNNDSYVPVITFSNNILPVAWNGLGGDNTVTDPMLQHLPTLDETQFTNWLQAQVMWQWLSPRPGSPAKNSGPFGTDKGAVIPGGLRIAGEPPATTTSREATLTVGPLHSGNGIPTAGFPQGSGYTHYQWRLDQGQWSQELPVTTPIVLSGLANGPHHVEVTGKRDSDWYQNAPELAPDNATTLSRTWTVDQTATTPLLNELLANNQGGVAVGDTTPDVIELFNPASTPVNLAGMTLTDDPLIPAKFTFPAGASIPAGGYWVLAADKSGSTNSTGFQLSRTGGTLVLSAPAGGGVIDSVTYGEQLPNLSVGRDSAGVWRLNTPTLGGSNVVVPTADPRFVRINEWLAVSAANPDFLELFNPEPAPVDLGGCFLSDSPAGSPDRFQFPPLSFIPANGFLVLTADGQDAPGHLNFKLNPEWGELGLFSPSLDQIDEVIYGPQVEDVSLGRSPNGSSQVVSFTVPSPGAGNPAQLGQVIITTVKTDLMSYDQVWKYNQTANLDGIAWTTPGYGDSAWPAGNGLLGFESDSGITPLIQTRLSDPRTPPAGLSAGHAYYFRTSLNVTNDLSAYTLTAKVRVDDGLVLYINGTEAGRLRMPSSAQVLNGTFATGLPSSGDTEADELISFPGSLLKPGANLIAAEVHQVNATSSDIVWGMGLEATRFITNVIQKSVVLNEVMANHRRSTNTGDLQSDWLELLNPGGTEVDLSGMLLVTGQPGVTASGQWSFPEGAHLPAGQRLVVLMDPNSPASTNLSTTLNAGFGLAASGDSVFLYKGDSLIDALTFGPQAEGYSLARNPEGSGPWTLSLPTPMGSTLPATLADPSALRFNEWMADPASGDDWFELFNPSSQPVSLAGLYLTDDLNKPTQFRIPPLSFIGNGARGAYLVFQADGNTAAGPTHTPFKLSASGESLGLFAADAAILLDGVTFAAQQKNVSEGYFPEGSRTLVRFPYTPTPGSANYLPFSDVTINEVLARGGLSQAIELHNPTDQTIDLSGYWLSDSLDNPTKFRLPNPTILLPGEFYLLNDGQFNPSPILSPTFTLDPARGGSLYLSATDPAGDLSGYRTVVSFGGSDPGVSFGLYDSSTGPQFVPMSSLTLSQSNSTPLVGPVVLNEINYHPPDQGTNDNTVDEYIELLNTTSAAVPLYDPAYPTNTWHLRNAVSYDFPTNTVIPAGSYALVVSFDPSGDNSMEAVFRAKYQVPSEVPIFGPWQGKLENGSDTVELNKPSGLIAGQVPRVLVDSLAFGDSAPWPTAADGIGSSLQRISPTAFGNDPVNWLAAGPTPGKPNEVATTFLPSFTSQPADKLVAPQGAFTVSAEGAGSPPLFYQWRLNGFDIPDATNSIFSVASASTADAGKYSVRLSNPFGSKLSSTATVALQSAPTIARQPEDGTASSGLFTFYVVARGTAPLTYHWKHNTADVAGNSGKLMVEAVAANAGDYQVVISNAYGAVTSSVANLVISGNTDTDGDGIPDAWMLEQFGHATGSATDHSLAGDDPDGDGLTNLQEYLAGTGPKDPASVLRLEAVSIASGAQVTFSFKAMPNRKYVIQRRTSLDTVWSVYANVPVYTTEQVIQITDRPQTDSQAFYRVLVTP